MFFELGQSHTFLSFTKYKPGAQHRSTGRPKAHKKNWLHLDGYVSGLGRNVAAVSLHDVLTRSVMSNIRVVVDGVVTLLSLESEVVPENLVNDGDIV